MRSKAYTILACLAVGAAFGSQAQQLATDGFTGGLLVHLHCGDGTQTVELPEAANCVIHALDTDPGNVKTARKRLKAAGRYGSVTVGQFDGRRLPYTDNLVNMIVSSAPTRVPQAEIMRVLAPLGIVHINGKRTQKPWPDDIDEWTHFLHSANGNAVAKDTRIHNPRRVQWWSGPRHSRDHDALASLSAMVSCGGRLFYILDEGPISQIHHPPEWKLVARDAFNGVVLWKRTIPDWVTHLYSFRVGPVWLGRKLVAVEDRVYTTLGLDAPVSALDTVTGDTRLTYAGSEKTEEIVCHDGVLLLAIGNPGAMNAYAPKPNLYAEIRDEDGPTFDRAVAAYDAKTGERLWKRDEPNLKLYVPMSLAAHGDRAFFMDNEGIFCVDLKSGGDIWKAPFTTKGLFLRNYAPTFVASPKAVVCVSDEKIAAFDAQTGRQLWQKDQGFYGFASPADLFVIGDSLWTGHTYKGDLKDIQEINLLSGEVKRTLEERKILPGGHHHRCYRNRATERYLLMGRRCVEFVDLQGSEHQHNWFVRGICQFGILPANGQLVVPPDPCRCFTPIKANGFWSFVASNHVDDLPVDDTRLTKGAAFERVARAAVADAPPIPKAAPGTVWYAGGVHVPEGEDWPTYRHDIARSGSVKTDVPGQLRQVWAAKVGIAPRSPVSVDGKVFVPCHDHEGVVCLDGSTGSTVWEFTAGGAVDSPPTIHQGLALFGAHDGYAYAVAADTGELAWRFRVAPVDNLVMNEGRLASAWPVHGSVLVVGNTAYVAAGRSSFVDEGIRIFGLNACTGEKLHETTVHTLAPRPDLNAELEPPPEPKGAEKGKRRRRPKSSTTTPKGLLMDVLRSDGKAIFMRQQSFGLDLKPGSGGGPGLCTDYGFLSDSWMHRVNWTLGGRRNYAGPFGKLIVFDAEHAFGAQCYYSWQKRSPWKWPSNHTGHHHQKYSRYKPDMFPFGVRLFAQANQRVTARPETPDMSNIDEAYHRWANAGASSTVGHAWSYRMPAQIRAMALTNNVLFVAGCRDSIAIHDELREEDTGTPALWAVDRADGKTLAEYPLAAAPVFDGLIAASGKLYVVLKNGDVVCFAGVPAKKESER